MDFKRILLTLTLGIMLSRNYRVQAEFVDIVLQFNDSYQNNYTRFINVTQQLFLWLSSVVCDNNTFSYSIIYDTHNGSVISNSSTTFMMKQADPNIYLKEFMCSSPNTNFECTRQQNNQNCEDNRISRMYLNTDTSSTCPDRCVTMCPISPVQSILFTYNVQNLKIPFNAECQNLISYQTSTLKSSDSSASNQRTTSTIISQNQTEDSNVSNQGTTLTSKSDSTLLSTDYSPSSPENAIKTLNDSLPVIIGASVGGGALIVIMIILILVCLKITQKRNQLKNPQSNEQNCDNTKENEIKTKKQHNRTDEVDHKTYVTNLANARCVNKLTAHIDCTETSGSNNMNVNNDTYSCVENDAKEILEKDNISKINKHQRQFQPCEFLNPEFRGSGMDYSSITDLNNGINNNANSNVGIYTSEPPHNSGNTYSTLGQNTRSVTADVYSTLGEKTRSVSDTYYVMPTVSNKKGHKSLGAISDYDNNRGNSSNVNLGDNVGEVDGAPNDVYAQVIKPLRKLH